jgi:hypothetical protein
VVVLRCGDGDIARAAAEVLTEGLDVLEADPGLEGVEVDADPSDADDVVAAGGHGISTVWRVTAVGVAASSPGSRAADTSVNVCYDI